ncbi:MAG: hypothetical protein N2578_04695 [Bdellovibrionaceae bacterium]|nr:hypothetical protein [Pseudobdellovibrionaceae bacterium]
MLWDIPVHEDYERRCDEVRRRLHLSSGQVVRLYKGLSHAVFEVTLGLAQFMSHKRSFAVIKGMTPHADPIVAHLLKEAYRKVYAFAHDFSPDEFLLKLEKDTCFVLIPEEHAVTAEIFPWVDHIEEELNKRKIFAIRISHCAHLYRQRHLLPYSVRVCSYGPYLAAVFAGERIRLPQVLSHQMEWRDSIASVLERSISRQESQFLVENIETEFFMPLDRFRNGRIFDRAILHFSDASADALAKRLGRKLNLTDEKLRHYFQTPNACYTNAFRQVSSWWQPTPAEDDLRGLLVISVEALQLPGFVEHLRSARDELRREQSW